MLLKVNSFTIYMKAAQVEIQLPDGRKSKKKITLKN